MKTTKIYTVFHEDWQRERYQLTDDGYHEWYNVKEDVGINYMNPVWSEMVAMLNVWRSGKRYDYIGFNHYRRQFDVRRLPKAGECQIFTRYDFGMTIYEQYAARHRREDIDTVIGLLNMEYGIGNGYVNHLLNDRKMIGNCCFLMSWEDYDKMMRYLFQMIEAYTQHEGCGNDVEQWENWAARNFGFERRKYQMRIISFLAERLISAWITVHMKPYEQKDAVICHYNTPELTEACIKSLRKHTPDVNVFVFDNSNRRPFTAEMEGVKVIDNTKGKYINFRKFLDGYPRRVDETINDWASAKHSYTVDFMTDVLPNGFLLMDSDILIKKDVTGFFRRDRAYVGMNYVNRAHKLERIPRVLPFLCWLNVPNLHAAGIRYFDGARMWKLRPEYPWKWWDTGAVLYHDVRAKGLQGQNVNVWEYIEHFGSASFVKSEEQAKNWLEKHKDLYE